MTAATRERPERPPGTIQTFSNVYWLCFLDDKCGYTSEPQLREGLSDGIFLEGH